MLFASLPVGKSMLNIDSRLIHYKELRVLGSSDSTPAHVRKAVEILSSGNFPADAIVTHRLPLDGIEQAFQLMKSGESLRVALIP
jgi:L-iditol 2-dehydrogenase